ncbi:hypothetical protein D3C73_19760 [compost metagenome]
MYLHLFVTPLSTPIQFTVCYFGYAHSLLGIIYVDVYLHKSLQYGYSVHVELNIVCSIFVLYSL